MSPRRDVAAIVTELAMLDGLLARHAGDLGDDFVPYRNHAARVANLCLARTDGGADAMEKVAIAAAFHDLGIWTARTFDYLEPSVRLATGWLDANGKAAWTDEIAETIRQHHKISRYTARLDWLVEPFRQADWTDVTAGVLTFGAERRFIGELYRRWPDCGFHRLLVRLEFRHLRRHPFNPLPMMKL